MELRDTNTVCYRIVSYLLWYSTMVSVCLSVRSYFSTDLPSIHEGSRSKEDFIEPMEPPLDPPLETWPHLLSPCILSHFQRGQPEPEKLHHL